LEGFLISIEKKVHSLMVRFKSISIVSILSILLFVLTFFVFANSMDNQFTNWDDDELIVGNIQIRSLALKNIKEIFTAGGTYQPIRVLSYAIDYYFFGLDHRGYHLHNILLHALASVFLFLSLCIILKQISNIEKYTKGNVNFVAFCTALLFIIHPVNCEAVVWLSGRKYVLLSFFSFLSLFFYAKGTIAKKNNLLYVVCSAVSVVFSTISSPFGITFPAIFVVYDYARDDSMNLMVSIKNNLKRYLFFIIPGAIVFIKLWTVLVGSGGASTAHLSGNPLNTLWTMIRVIHDYARNFILPLWLNNRYPDYIFLSPFRYKVIIVILLFMLIGFILVKQLKKGDKSLLFCVSWFLLLWLPASNIIPISTKMADRYIYTASVGIYLWTSLMVSYWIENKITMDKHKIRIAVVSILILYFGFFTINRNMAWRDSGTLWSDSIKKDSNNFLAHNNLGVHLQYVKGDIKGAIVHYKEAIRLNPKVGNPYENITECFLTLKEYKQAVPYLEKWLSLYPGDSKIHFKMGIVLVKLGLQDNAEEYFQNTIEINKNHYEANYYLGLHYAEKEEFEKAKKFYKKALEIRSDHSESLNNLGNIHMSLGDYDKAEDLFKRAVRVNKNNLVAHFNLGIVCSKKNDSRCAADHFKKVVDIDPKDAVAHFLLGIELLKLGENYDGANHVKQAMKIEPHRNEFNKFYESIKNEI
jgi:protein O-mannosyl-transferase